MKISSRFNLLKCQEKICINTEHMSRLAFISDLLGTEKKIHYSLDRFRLALNHIGNPQKDLLSFIVAGTNGKGSTSLFISAGLHEAGFKVATFLSPHLYSPCERFLWNLCPIAEEELETLAHEFLPVAQKYELTYFEFLTLLFFVWVRGRGVDFVVLEVGLGGRLDATNVTDPLACALTNIGLDHQKFLGDTKEEILQEKLGVLNSEGLLFTGVQEPELIAAIEAKCTELDSIFYYVSELKICSRFLSFSQQEFTINDYPFLIHCALQGFQQNSALAFLLLRIVFPKFSPSLFSRAFARVLHPGRFEVVQENPRVILSGDHNLEGVENMVATLQALGNPRVHTLCAFSPDKPYLAMVEKLRSVSETLRVGMIPQFRGSYSEDYFPGVRSDASPDELLTEMLGKLSPADTLLVTGSLYWVGALRKVWRPSVEFLVTPPSVAQPTDLRWGGPSRAKLPAREVEQTPAR